jgi:hypothetical protein
MDRTVGGSGAKSNMRDAPFVKREAWVARYTLHAGGEWKGSDADETT